jgi:dTDP-4-amino-4,6-dideoxygalactose transaminase
MEMDGTAPLVVEGGRPTCTVDVTLPDAVPPEAMRRVAEVIESGCLYRYSGPEPRRSEVSLLEQEFAELVGTRYAVAFNSCSSAMFVALLCAGVQPGSEVLMPAFTFTAVPSTVVHAGGVPVMVECGPDYCLDIDDLRAKAVGERRVLLASHMRGHISDLDAITSIATERGLTVVEDAAHSLGGQWRGRPAGTFGAIGCFSFQSYKIVNAGEGGILVTDDEEYAAKAALYSGAFESLWQHHPFTTERFAALQKTVPTYNMRMSNVTAAIVRPQLPLIEQKKATYAKNYQALATMLTTSEFVDLPLRDERESPVLDSMQFAMRDMRREQIEEFIRIVRLEGIALHSFGLDPGNARAFWNWKYLTPESGTTRTREILNRTCDLRLPVGLTPEDVDMLGTTLLRALRYVMDKQVVGV